MAQTDAATKAIASTDDHDVKAVAFFGSWMVIGLFLDGWAHVANKPETFFSPWHFILYSGFGAAVTYFMFRERILKKPSSPDRLTTAGLVVFIIGAVGDGAWHQIFGIEVDLEALFSPTHLALMIGGLLMLGIGYRAAMRAERRDESAGIGLIVTMTLAAAVSMFFTQYFSAYSFGGLFPTPGGGFEDYWEIHAVGSVFVTNAILLGLVFLLVRHWRTPRFTFTVAFAALATGMVLLDGADGPMLHIAAAALGGLVTDLLVRRLHSSESVRGARVFSVVVPLALWLFWFGAIYLMDGVHWAAELWTGTVILTALQGAGLGLLAFPGERTPGRGRTPQATATIAQPDATPLG